VRGQVLTLDLKQAPIVRRLPPKGHMARVKRGLQGTGVCQKAALTCLWQKQPKKWLETSSQEKRARQKSTPFHRWFL
jgi:hypothetical protein